MSVSTHSGPQAAKVGRESATQKSMILSKANPTSTLNSGIYNGFVVTAPQKELEPSSLVVTIDYVSVEDATGLLVIGNREITTQVEITLPSGLLEKSPKATIDSFKIAFLATTIDGVAAGEKKQLDSSLYSVSGKSISVTLSTWGIIFITPNSTTASAPNLSYTSATGTSVYAGNLLTVTPTTLANNGSEITSCGIKSGTTSLPAWLSIHKSTCVISGTPTSLLSTTTFTIIATNAIGTSASATVNITVLGLAPELSFSGATGNIGMVNGFMSIAPTTLATHNLSLTACGIKSGTTALPGTLTVNASTCVISGTPTSALSATTYSIVATNEAGNSQTATVSIGVYAATWNLDAGAIAGTSNSGSISSSSATTWVDLSSSAKDAALNHFAFNSATSGWNGVGTPMSPYALNLDGSDDYVKINTSVASDAYSVWFNASTITGSTHQILRKANTAMQIYIDSSGSLTCSFNNASTPLSTGISAGKWYHVMAVQTGGNATYYLNGAKIGSTTAASDAGSGSIFVGSSNGATNFFVGAIGSVTTYTGTFTDADINAIYASYKSHYVAPSTSLQLDSLVTNVGSTAGGSSIVLQGWNFDGVTSVKFGATAASSFSIDSAHQITAVTPAGTAGYVDVLVSDGTNASTIAGGFRYSATTTANLIAFVDPAIVNGAGLHGNTATSSSSAIIASSGSSATILNTPATGTATSGWYGAGATSNPYRINLDGADDYLHFGAHAAIASYSIWFNATNPANGSTQAILRSSTGTAYAFLQANGLLVVQYGGSKTVATPIAAATWNHLAFSWSANTVSAYLNGVKFGTISGVTQESSGFSTVGSVDTMSAFFGGSFGDIRAYSAALAAQDIMNLYQEGKSIYTTLPSLTTISSISPSIGSIAGGSSVTILGEHFTGATSVTFGGVNAAAYTVVSDHEISATTPVGGAGYVNVVVVSPQGTSTSTSSYRYTATQLSTLTTLLDPANIDNNGARGSSITAVNWSSANPSYGGARAVNIATPSTSSSGWGGSSPYRLNIDGSDDFAYGYAEATSTYTVWFYADSTSGATSYIFAHSTATYAYLDSYGAGNFTLTAVYNSSTPVTTTVAANSWHHLAMVQNGGTTSFYLDGNTTAFGSQAVAAETGEGYIYYGSDTSAANNLKGFLGPVRLYSGTISVTDVSDIYNEDVTWYP